MTASPASIPPSAAIDARAAALLEPLTALVTAAGAAILAIRRGAVEVAEKADGSPVTQADLAADRIIADGLARLAPDIASLSEECAGAAEAPLSDLVFVVDPLDGTKEFIAGRDEFTVNVALVAHGTPILGVVGAPALGVVWRGHVGHGAARVTGAACGEGAVVEPIHTRPLPAPGHPWIAAVSRSHGDARTDAFIAARPGATRKTLGSAVKFGRVAEGCVDIYPRLAPTSEWDVAAGHAVVVAAGGKVTDAQGQPLRYGAGRPGFLLPNFIAWGDPAAI
ncbi:MAG: 3'(2'),5'-bisphosphate nucleotidase CysQ [Xanthobacteraceae bacterium]|nr:3'(2'),5'-bisphosphate nucleotidase CysQ [Xanthobacteraceae bacterium]